MKLDQLNLRLFKHEKGHSLKIMMPDESENYLHLQLYNDVESMILIRDLLLGQEVFQNDIAVREDGTYYRIYLNIKNANDEIYSFHSRKLNINDVVYERMQLLK